jgi:hypothetical protein
MDVEAPEFPGDNPFGLAGLVGFKGLPQVCTNHTEQHEQLYLSVSTLTSSTYSCLKQLIHSSHNMQHPLNQFQHNNVENAPHMAGKLRIPS